MKSARVVFRVARGVEVRVSQGICRLFGSCPLRCKTLVFPGFFAFLANCFGFPARPCTCMLAHAASSSALPWPLVSRPVSRQSRLRTLVFLGKTGGFAAEGVRFELVGDVLKRAETSYHSIQLLFGSQVTDIIQLRIEVSLRDRLHWCGLQSLG
jgi:hypothetical protein